MRHLTVARVGGTKGGTTRLTLNDGGVAVNSWQGRFGSDKALNEVAKEIGGGVTRHWLRACLDAGDDNYGLPEAAVEAVVDVPVKVRGINETDEQAKHFDVFEKALAYTNYPGGEPLI